MSILKPDINGTLHQLDKYNKNLVQIQTMVCEALSIVYDTYPELKQLTLRKKINIEIKYKYGMVMYSTSVYSEDYMVRQRLIDDIVEYIKKNAQNTTITLLENLVSVRVTDVYDPIKVNSRFELVDMLISHSPTHNIPLVK